MRICCILDDISSYLWQIYEKTKLHPFFEIAGIIEFLAHLSNSEEYKSMVAQLD